MINYSIDERNKLILWKLSFIQMKILNDIACCLNWIQFLKLYSNALIGIWIEFHFNKRIELNWIELDNWIKIQLKRNRMQIGEGIKNLLGNMVLGKKKFKKHKDPKEHKFMALHLRMS